jgi:hypothetical protein
MARKDGITKEQVKNVSAFKGGLSRFDHLLEETHEVKYSFVLVELDLALTFLRIAQWSRDQAKVERNLRCAEKARKSAMRFLAEVRLTEQRKKIIQEKLEELEEQSLSGSLLDMVMKIDDTF